MNNNNIIIYPVVWAEIERFTEVQRSVERCWTEAINKKQKQSGLKVIRDRCVDKALIKELNFLISLLAKSSDLTKYIYLVASVVGILYWFLFLVLHPWMHLTVKLQLMTIPYSFIGLALLLVSRDSFRAKHYFISFNTYVGLLIAGSLA